MFENNIVHKGFRASEIKHVTDGVIRTRQEEAYRKEQALIDRYNDWIIKWGISVNGAKTLESIMINIEDEGTHGHYTYTHYFRLGRNSDEDIEIIKDILEDYGFNVSYKVRNKEPLEETIATIAWR